jgi:hypothetical protein
MSPQTFAALVRGQLALGFPRSEAEDIARFVVDTLCCAQSVMENEKATAATVASSVLSKHKINYVDLSTKELRTQDLSLTNSQFHPFNAPKSPTTRTNPYPAAMKPAVQ